MKALILAINPGSTSTKIALFDGHHQLFAISIRHSSEALSQFKKIAEQFDFRKEAILHSLKENGIDIDKVAIIMARGGLLKPIASGVYEINSRMLEDLKVGVGGEHASNLGGLIAHSLGKEIEGCRTFIADPVVVDELQPVARITGHPLFPRRSIFHALNQKSVAKSYAVSINREYNSLNLIVAHLGGGISIGVHSGGEVIDVNNALDGEGPFSPERAGSLPAYDLAKLCFSGEYTLEEVRKMLIGHGGLVAHLGTNSFIEVTQRVQNGDQEATLISDAFAYNVAKAIGAAATVLHGKVDAILLTGGVAFNKVVVDQIVERVSFIAEVKIFPGENEMYALAMNGLDLLNGRVEPIEYR
ncbi:MAG: butyrate kinase [Bacteroidales bacterium]